MSQRRLPNWNGAVYVLSETTREFHIRLERLQLRYALHLSGLSELPPERTETRALMKAMLILMQDGGVSVIDDVYRDIDVSTISSRVMGVLTRCTYVCRNQCPNWLGFARRCYQECLRRGEDAAGIFCGITEDLKSS